MKNINVIKVKPMRILMIRIVVSCIVLVLMTTLLQVLAGLTEVTKLALFAREYMYHLIA